ncbi:hypothetical protein GM658_12485 [Pseudoduganella eburnea]|uniref:Uncharacterized protein n=1 Tax=Massilia eburnea TaxID=1776165 RepID=A0A6L6QH63_9BURK|nr:hypothetical protein [Massilia eburnea]MTW11414.1 hypothetical protein [Massilia eburnea]
MMEPTISSTLPHQALPISWVESLFKRMHFSYGARFADMWAGVNPDEMKQHWAQRLGELSRSELATGYRMLESRDWPPTLPEFIKLCRPNLDPEPAFYEALAQGIKRERADPHDPDVWSHPAIYWAWVKIGAFAIANQGYEALRPRWVDALRHYVELPGLEAVPEKRQELPAPGKARLRPERARELLSQLRLKGMPQRAGVSGQTEWAKTILEKYGRGESVCIAAIEMAEEALGLRT